MEDVVTEMPEALAELKGAFVSSLVRNNKKIREDRAIAIVEAVELQYKRTVEDLETKIKKIKRERDNMLDLSPKDANSLVLASEFDEKGFVDKDLDLGIKLRNLEISLDVAKTRYKHLFIG